MIRVISEIFAIHYVRLGKDLRDHPLGESLSPLEPVCFTVE